MAKKSLCLLLAVTMAMGVVACAPKQPGGTGKGKFNPGTYEGEAEGYNGPIKVKVTVTENEITDIQVEHTETPGLGDKAIEDIVALVKKNTSLNIDAVSGATYSSKGVLEAITIALEKAGADIKSLQSKKIEDKPTVGDIEKTADVIVIGGGGAGLAAAVSVIFLNYSNIPFTLSINISYN